MKNKYQGSDNTPVPLARHFPDSMTPVNPTDLDSFIDKYIPLKMRNYNMGLLPDEEGYMEGFAAMRCHSENEREEAKAQLQAIIATECDKTLDRHLNDGAKINWKGKTYHITATDMKAEAAQKEEQE